MIICITLVWLFLPKRQTDHDPRHEIRPMLDHLDNVFKRFHVSKVNFSIDESMIGSTLRGQPGHDP